MNPNNYTGEEFNMYTLTISRNNSKDKVEVSIDYQEYLFIMKYLVRSILIASTIIPSDIQTKVQETRKLP